MPNALGPKGLSKLLRKRIPTVVGLGLLILGVGAGIYLVGQGTSGFLPRASSDTVPKQVRITNVTDTGFSVSFLTDAAAPGYIRYGTAVNSFTTQTADDRDQLTNAVGSYTTHHITVRGLQPQTQYYFRLGTGSRQLFDNNGQPFSVRTARRLDSPGEAKTAYGTILNAVGNPANNALVYVTAPGAAPLSSLVKENGSWAVPLSSLRTTDLSAGKTLADADEVRIQVVGTQAQELIETAAPVSALMPLNPLTFGQDNSAVTAQPSPSPTTEESTETSTDTTSSVAQETPGSSSTASTFGTLFSEQEGTQVDVTAPVRIQLQDNEVISTTKPEFVGKAPANSYLQISVHSSTPYNGVVQTDASGNWQWSPPADLEPGQHTVTLTYTDENGAQQQIQRTFIVQADSLLPAFVSTPSAQVEPSPSPEPSPEPSPSPRVVTPQATEQPVSGSTTTTFGLLFLGIAFFGAGIVGTRSFLRQE